jgi:hypothetical protein
MSEIKSHEDILEIGPENSPEFFAKEKLEAILNPESPLNKSGRFAVRFMSIGDYMACVKGERSFSGEVNDFSPSRKDKEEGEEPYKFKNILRMLIGVNKEATIEDLTQWPRSLRDIHYFSEFLNHYRNAFFDAHREKKGNSVREQMAHNFHECLLHTLNCLKKEFLPPNFEDKDPLVRIARDLDSYNGNEDEYKNRLDIIRNFRDNPSWLAEDKRNIRILLKALGHHSAPFRGHSDSPFLNRAGHINNQYHVAVVVDANPDTSRNRAISSNPNADAFGTPWGRINSNIQGNHILAAVALLPDRTLEQQMVELSSDSANPEMSHPVFGGRIKRQLIIKKEGDIPRPVYEVKELLLYPK